MYGSGGGEAKTIGSINGYPVCKVTREDVNCTLSNFAKALEEWEEGEPGTEISAQELKAIKEKYKSDRMTEAQSIQFFGDLVEAGIISKSSASMIYHGITSLDLSNYNGTSQGTLKKGSSIPSTADLSCCD